jgi:hypothetical protein
MIKTITLHFVDGTALLMLGSSIAWIQPKNICVIDNFNYTNVIKIEVE